CTQAATGKVDGEWLGSDLWREMADRACAEAYVLEPPLRTLIETDAINRMPDSWLPLPVYESLLPRLEATRNPGAALLSEAEAALQRLEQPVDFSEGPALAVRWQLARIDLHLALGHLDEAKSLLTELIEAEPNLPLVLANGAQLYALIGEREQAAVWAEAVAEYDPRPAARMLLDQGRLHDAAAIMDRYAISRG
ncbi:MAG: hypothetical protein KC457_36650, partial [Myxococcales bacterium]|nr:hypothetical protein [Myxococcales bacterium]